MSEAEKSKQELLESLAIQQALEDARRSLSLAGKRCLSFDELLTELRQALIGTQSEEVVLAIVELDRSKDQDATLTAVLHSILEGAEAPSPKRDWLERSIARILRKVRPEVAAPLALNCLKHRRKSRRTIGFRAASGVEIDEAMTKFCEERFRQTNDDRFLKLLLARPLQLNCIDPTYLLTAFDEDEYWRMRVIESTLRADQARGVQLGLCDTKQFIWAAGRLGLGNLVEQIKESLQSSNEPHKLLGIAAWAFGKFGVTSELAWLSKFIDEVSARYMPTNPVGIVQENYPKSSSE